MDRSDIMRLISVSYSTDGIGQKVPEETSREVFCDVKSVGQREWFEAGRNGLKAVYQVSMFAADYKGEEICEYGGTRYGIYRTYRANQESIELYLERKAGL
mgnify:CR=1 FL=1